MNDRDLLIQILRQRSIAFGDFVLASGRRSTYYVDARKTTMSAAGLAVIGRLGLQLIRERGWQPAAVGGLTMGADPVAYAIARASAELPPIIDGFSVRKAAKEHGTKQRVEGNFDRGIQVVVVEDVITSGSSALQAIEAIRAEGGNPLGVVAVVDRLQGGAEAITKAAGLDVVSMTTVRDFGIQPT